MPIECNVKSCNVIRCNGKSVYLMMTSSILPLHKCVMDLMLDSQISFISS